ncbi:MAG: thioredoxin-disulfide reductase [Candidatus Omnitrophota bacterium]|nr:thioredoxin-disulfide reductase [Candidatus Omnitrophota bacterium]
MDIIHDIVIIGGGPSGLTAGLYACRARMKVLLLEKMACGGQALLADKVENFPGFPDGVKGPELAEWMLKQAEHFGLEVKSAEAKRVSPQNSGEKTFAIELAGGERIAALSVIIAAGARWNALNIPGEKELTGRGVSYCATCDGPLFRGKDVVVVGGGDTALGDAIFLTKFADKVTVIHRRDKLRAAKILQERALANKKIELCLNSIATEIIGRNKVEGIKIKDAATNAERVLKADGVFVLIGLAPNSDVVKGLVKSDEKGYIIADDEMRTSTEGIFACGDVRQKLLRQVVTAAGDGATAAFSAQHYVERLKGTEYK